DGVDPLVGDVAPHGFEPHDPARPRVRPRARGPPRRVPVTAMVSTTPPPRRRPAPRLTGTPVARNAGRSAERPRWQTKGRIVPCRGDPMQQRQIGDRSVSAIGLGGMPMSIEGRPDEARSIATIHAALEAGVTLIDTADAYHLDPTDVGHNELLIAKALRLAGASADDVLVATKGGHRRPGDGSWYVQGDAAYLKKACEASLQRLDVEAIGLYQFHRPDPAVGYADSVGAVR